MRACLGLTAAFAALVLATSACGSTSITFMGTDTIDGATVELWDVAETGDDGTQSTSQVAVDPEDRLVRLTMEETNEVMSMSAVLTQSGFDEPVDIQAPPADQIEG